ncbi:MAG: VWA domain-containing protein [Chloroflexota bacterium]
MTFTARSDRQFIRSTYRSNRFVLAQIDAPAAPRERARPPVHLAFVIDRSGSMNGEKIRLAKLAVEESLARLHDDDRFAIVVYDEVVDVVFPSTHATAEARSDALARLTEIDARGSTDLGAGWLRGCEQVALALSDEGVNRTLLLTDGLANHGITDRDELARHAAELRARGVSTTTFGVGQDFDEVLLQAMADAGGGHFYFIANAASIADYVTSEVGETLEIVARDVAVEVTAPEGVVVESLSPYPTNTSAGGRTTVILGDLVAEQRLQVVIRLNFPYGEIGDLTGALIAITDREGVLGSAGAKLAWEYADNRVNDGQDRDREVDRAVARIFAARARQEAVGYNRAGDYGGAREALSAVTRRIRDYAGRDTELREIVADLERESDRMAAPMPEMARKQAHYQASTSARMRSFDGKAMKRPHIGGRQSVSGRVNPRP